jgi:DNA modification methylase
MTLEMQVERLKGIDWGFASEDTRYLTHPIHRYSSKFPPQVASRLIEELTSPGELVLDNFVGSGTTLVEANLLKRHSVGVDLNPVACLVSATKVRPIHDPALERAIEGIVSVAGGRIARLKGQDTLNRSSTPEPPVEKIGAKTSRWFFESDLRDLTSIRDAISGVDDISIRRLALVSLSEILRRCSKAHSAYANLMVDKKARPKGHALNLFVRQLVSNRDRIKELNRKFNVGFEPDIIRGDARNLRALRDERFHLVISHPPYIGAVPYAEFLALSLLWLGHDPRELDGKLIGGRRQRKDVVERYMEDMNRVFLEMYRVLLPSRYCCVVIGNPVVFGNMIPLNENFVTLGKRAGFRYITELSRRRINMRKGILRDEYILVFRKS